MQRNPLLLPLAEIPERGLELRVDTQEGRFAELLTEASESGLEADGHADLTVELWPERVDVRGQLSAQVGQVCVRCLAPYLQEVDWKLNHILLRQPEFRDEEIELTRKDLDRSELTGDELDLAGILREELQLALPVKPLCEDDCKGICPGCGAELNSEPCSCEPVVDERWNALKGLKLDS